MDLNRLLPIILDSFEEFWKVIGVASLAIYIMNRIGYPFTLVRYEDYSIYIFAYFVAALIKRLI